MKIISILPSPSSSLEFLGKEEKICKSLIYIDRFLAKSSLSYKMYHTIVGGLEVKLRMSVEELNNKKHQKKKNTDRYFLESTVIKNSNIFWTKTTTFNPANIWKSKSLAYHSLLIHDFLSFGSCSTSQILTEVNARKYTLYQK